MNFYPCFVACPKGTFGQNCRKTCGNCLHNTTCNHENGTCPNGCDAGFKGQYCSTCEFENTWVTYFWAAFKIVAATCT